MVYLLTHAYISKINLQRQVQNVSNGIQVNSRKHVQAQDWNDCGNFADGILRCLPLLEEEERKERRIVVQRHV